MCYTIESLTCAIIEKLLRIAYVNESKNIPEEKDDKTKKGDKNKNKNKSGKTLGTLLWDKKIEQIFNYDHLKSLQFLLSESNGIGLNIRNSLAHWKNIDKEMLTPLFVSRMLWLFTDVLNTVLLYFLKQQGN
jgi:hypothetical protein